MTTRKGPKYDVVAVVPLGGSGTRFYPATLDTPKQLIPIANHEILGAAIYHWTREGATDVVFGATGYDNRVQTKRFFGSGGRFSKASDRARFYFANYDDEIFAQKGSADVFMWCTDEYRDMMGDRNILLINGDNMSTTLLGDFCEAHMDKRALMTIAVKAFNINDPRLEGFGTVTFDKNKQVTRFDEKSRNPTSRYVNTAICMFSPELHKLLRSAEFRRSLEERRSRGRLDMGGHFIPTLVDEGLPVYAYILEGPWADIGTFDSFQETTRAILHGEYPNLGEGDYHIGDQSLVSSRAAVKNSVIGENVVIGDNVTLDETTLFSFSRVEDGAHITNAIIGHRTKVGKNAVIETGAFLGDDLRVPDSMTIGVDWRVARDAYYDRVMDAKASDSGPMYELVEKLGKMKAFAFKERRVQSK